MSGRSNRSVVSYGSSRGIAINIVANICPTNAARITRGLPCDLWSLIHSRFPQFDGFSTKIVLDACMIFVRGNHRETFLDWLTQDRANAFVLLILLTKQVDKIRNLAVALKNAVLRQTDQRTKMTVDEMTKWQNDGCCSDNQCRMHDFWYSGYLAWEHIDQ